MKPAPVTGKTGGDGDGDGDGEQVKLTGKRDEGDQSRKKWHVLSSCRLFCRVCLRPCLCLGLGLVWWPETERKVLLSSAGGYWGLLVLLASKEMGSVPGG